VKRLLFLICIAAIAAHPVLGITGPAAITAPGSYALQNNISGGDAEGCIEIVSSDVFFDGFGHTILSSEGTSRHGILVHPEAGRITNVSVVNVSVTGWDVGMFFRNVDQGLIRGATAQNNTLNGICLEESRSVRVEGNNASENGYPGIALNRSGENVIRGNDVRANKDAGMYLLESAGNLIEANTLSQNRYNGLCLESASGNTISSNYVYANGLPGIALAGSDRNDLFGNTVTGNSEGGMYLANASRNTITGNTVTGSPCGIILAGALSGNNITDNVLDSPVDIGLEMSSGNKIALRPVPRDVGVSVPGLSALMGLLAAVLLFLRK